MTKMRRIEADPAGAANLMKELVGRFRSELVEDEQPLWQGIVHPDGNWQTYSPSCSKSSRTRRRGRNRFRDPSTSTIALTRCVLLHQH